MLRGWIPTGSILPISAHRNFRRDSISKQIIYPFFTAGHILTATHQPTQEKIEAISQRSQHIETTTTTAVVAYT